MINLLLRFAVRFFVLLIKRELKPDLHGILYVSYLIDWPIVGHFGSKLLFIPVDVFN